MLPLEVETSMVWYKEHGPESVIIFANALKIFRSMWSMETEAIEKSKIKYVFKSKNS
jgi:hypothetical protein